MSGLKICLNDKDFLNFATNFDFLFFSETWQRRIDEFEVDEYKSILVPCVINNSSIHRHDGIARIITAEIDPSGFICVKLCKLYFQLEFDVYVCCTYIPPSNSLYFLSHHTVFF